MIPSKALVPHALRGRNLKPSILYFWDEPYSTKMLLDENPFEDCIVHMLKGLQF